MIYIFICIFIIMLLLFIIIKINSKNKYLSKILSNYENIINDQGKKNHEFNNQLLVIQGYINNKQKLKEYLNTIIDECRTGQHFEIRQLAHLPQGGIKNLIYCKYKKMEDKKIKSYIYIHEDVKDVISNLKIKDYKDLTKILGILIDNAIDAASISKEKEISIDFKIDDKYFVINITNSIDNDENIKNIGSVGYTTKGKGHGFGMMIIRDILKNNNKYELVTENTTNTFSQTVLLDI